MILLPAQPRRAWLQSFWLVMCVCVGSVSGALAALLASPRIFVLGMALALVSAVPGVLWPERTALRLYEAWNRLARLYARGGRFMLLGLCFCLLVVIGQDKQFLKLGVHTRGQSMWVPRKILAPRTYGSQWSATATSSLQDGWISNFFSWARHSGNVWALYLLPFLILVRVLEKEDDSSFPPNIYTLF